MRGVSPRLLASIALVAALLGLTFAGLSTGDYVQHLDRQLHDLHCSFIPGAAAEHGADTACRAAMNSPYSAIFRSSYWGGLPIALFAVGAFVFFSAFAIYLVLSGHRAPKRATRFLGAVGLTPLGVSVVMFSIAWLKIGHFCKTCVGIYLASILLAVVSLAVLVAGERRRAAKPTGNADDTIVDPVPPFAVEAPSKVVSVVSVFAWLIALGVSTATPALLYIAAVPDYSSHITGCGTLEKTTESHGALLRVTPPGATQPATLFVDPLCPTCKAFHSRLAADGALTRLDTTLVLFPLDNACNWMLDRAVHPGACVVSKAVICAGSKQAMEVLEWSYENQDRIKSAAATSPQAARAIVRERWAHLDACIDAKDTGMRLDRMLRFVIDNHLPVSTPQLFLGSTRLCDEDTDIGLAYTLRKLAPGVVP